MKIVVMIIVTGKSVVSFVYFNQLVDTKIIITKK